MRLEDKDREKRSIGIEEKREERGGECVQNNPSISLIILNLWIYKWM